MTAVAQRMADRTYLKVFTALSETLLVKARYPFMRNALRAARKNARGD